MPRFVFDPAGIATEGGTIEMGNRTFSNSQFPSNQSCNSKLTQPLPRTCMPEDVQFALEAIPVRGQWLLTLSLEESKRSVLSWRLICLWEPKNFRCEWFTQILRLSVCLSACLADATAVPRQSGFGGSHCDLELDLGSDLGHGSSLGQQTGWSSRCISSFLTLSAPPPLGALSLSLSRLSRPGSLPARIGLFSVETSSNPSRWPLIFIFYSAQ